jgi:hypothetical protein
MKIAPPDLLEEQDDRFLRCQDALYVSFLKVLEDATEAGWRPQEALVALISLADNHALMLDSNAEIEELLAVLKKRR